MSQMHALVFDSYGSPLDVINIRQVARPEIGNDDVLVKVSARPVQPADFMFIEGRYRIKATFPQVAGLEAAGVIVDAGKNTGAKIGQHVAFRFPGTWAEYARVPASRLYYVPDNIADEAAAQFCLNPITAWALLDELGTKRGDWIIANAATSSVAQMVSHIGAKNGVSMLGLVRANNSPIQVPYQTIDINAPNLLQKIEAVTGGVHAAALLDSVGGSAITKVFPALRMGAKIVSFGLLGNEKAEIGNSEIIFKNLTWKGFGVDGWLARQTLADLGVMTQTLWNMILEGTILLPVRHKYALQDARDAIVDAAKSGSGKVLIIN